MRELEAAAFYLPAVAGLLGIPLEVGKGFRCTLPGHADSRPSASVDRRSDGTLHYRDWHERSGVKWLTMPEVYAARVTGIVRALRGPELATWNKRLLVDAGLVEPVRVEMPPLGASLRNAAAVAEGFRRLLECKWAFSPGEPTTFTAEFARGWCGVGAWAARDAIRVLVERGVIRRVGTHSWGCKKTWLYLPGGGEH